MGLHEELKDRWETDEFLGPVPTDFAGDPKAVKLIIVCESPSDKEVDLTASPGRAIRPANGSTGRNIANAVAKFDKNGAGAAREGLPNLGYYLTNLVKYRADVGLKAKEPDSAKRHRMIVSRISDLWYDSAHGEFIRNDIIEELANLVKANPKVSILFACGVHAKLKKIVKQIIADKRLSKLDWLQVRHPSKWSECHYLLIDPSRWEDMVKGDNCGICQRCPRLEKFRPKRANM